MDLPNTQELVFDELYIQGAKAIQLQKMSYEIKLCNWSIGNLNVIYFVILFSFVNLLHKSYR